MNLITLQFILLAFAIGLLFGSLIAYYIMRRSIKKNIKSISENIRILTAQRETKEQEIDLKKENLLLLADKLKQIENNIQTIRRREYKIYINSLNRLLDQTGIAQIDKSD